MLSPQKSLNKHVYWKRSTHHGRHHPLQVALLSGVQHKVTRFDQSTRFSHINFILSQIIHSSDGDRCLVVGGRG